MPIVECRICNTPFKTKDYWLRKGYGKYCSVACQRTAQKNGKFVDCFVCKQTIYKTLKEINHSKSGNHFCSKKCQTSWRNKFFSGSKHKNYKNGKYTHRTILLNSTQEKVCRLCKTRDERVLAVHHIDENHLNNEEVNLAYLCHNCHFLVHHDKLEKSKFMETLV